MDNDHLNDISDPDSAEAFSSLFHTYYRNLVVFAGNYLPDRESCENMVQNVFLKLWDNRSFFSIDSSLKSFLVKSVQNACLDELRHRNIIRIHETYTKTFGSSDDLNTEKYVFYSDLHDKLEEALAEMPAMYREAFEMSRFEKLKYSEIAKKTGVSQRTVEVRVSKAMWILRRKLAHFLSFIFFCLQI